MTVALQGDSVQPRPAVVIQGDAFAALATVALLPLTSTILPSPLMRIDVAPDAQNGVHILSQVMVHRIASVRREKVGAVIGHLDDVCRRNAAGTAGRWMIERLRRGSRDGAGQTPLPRSHRPMQPA